MVENKNTYFLLKIKIPEDLRASGGFSKKLDDAIDHVLYAMGTDSNSERNYTARKKDNSQQIYIFRTNNRKRKGQLNKFCDRYFDPQWNITYETRGLGLSDVPILINQIKKSNVYSMQGEQTYTGRDIKVFEAKQNWYDWQKEIYEMIFNPNGEAKVRDDREIIHLIDFKGNSGKSSFWKYLYVTKKGLIGRMTYGTASQLRSQIIKIGSKPIYIIDLTRTKGTNDREEDLLSLIEDAKSGLVSSPMYGSNSELIMDPPTIILSTNYEFKKGSLSVDRWSTYEIKNKKLGPKNALLKAKDKKINIKK